MNLKEIVSSGLDADKLDYLRRDSYHVGVAYGSFDLDRILHTLSSTAEGNLCVLEKGKDAVENYRLGRYLMHAQVYEHHTRLATDGMFLRAFELGIRDGTIDKNALRVGTRKNSYTSANHSNFLKYYLTLNDETITRQLLRAHGNAKRLIKDLCSRRLLKTAIELNTDLDVFDALKKKKISELDKSDMIKLEEEVARKVDCDPDLVISHLQQMTIKLYDRYDILVKRRDESILALEDVSPISASVKPIVKLFVFCPEKYRYGVRAATYNYFSLTPVNSSSK
jgi:HD superfamily phosphohydrolase